MSEGGKQGKLILVLGSSGSGKGTVLEALRAKHPEFIFPVSCTTRPPREGEKNGEVYYFISREEFERRKEAGEFLEWAEVHGEHLYGTLKTEILKPLSEGKIVIREVDVQGLRSIREMIPSSELASIFLTVKDWETLRQRIVRRGPISEEELAHRHASYLKEKEWEKECTVVIESIEGQIPQVIEQVEAAISGLVQ